MSPLPPRSISGRIPPGRRPQARVGRSAQIPLAVCMATAELLAEQPLEKLTVSGILARSGVSRTGFYYHFASKEAVIGALVEQIADELDERIAALPPRRAGSHDAIRRALAASFALWERHRAVLLVVQAAARGESRLAAIWRALVEERYVRPFAERVRAAQAVGALARGSDPLALSRALHWMSEQALYAHIARAEPAPAQVSIEALAHVWAASLGSVPAPGRAAAPRPAAARPPR